MTPEPSPGSADFPAELAVIEQRAAEWLAAHDDGLAPGQAEEFARWLEADRRHGRIYAEMEASWDLLDNLPPKPVVAARRPVPFARIGLTLAVAAGLAAALLLAPGRLAGGAKFAAREATGFGEVKRVELPDGSVIQLNTSTVLEVNFTPAERRIRLLSGEADFIVAKNPRRPFIVNAGQVNVRAVGTIFDVRRRADAVDLLVAEGRVRVEDADAGSNLLARPGAAEAPLLTAGQRVLIPARAAAAATPVQVTQIAALEIKRTLAWQERRLEFAAAPLEEIVAEFNRYNRTSLKIADADLARRRFGGSFQIDAPEMFVRMLETDFGVIAERSGDEIRLRQPQS